MSNQIKIAIRALVEYVYRSGSIDQRFRTSHSMIEGTKVHQKIQHTYQEKDLKEVHLQTVLESNGYQYEIEGRCDGILFYEEKVMIDEIKSTSLNIASITESSYPVHWAQAKFYAYIFSQKESLNEIDVQITYVQLESEEKKQFVQTFSFDELETFAFNVIAQFAPYAELKKNHQITRNESIENLSFPFETFRPGQRKLAAAVYKTIMDKKNLFALAPTGIGKTISTTFPAIKAFPNENLEKIFYLTAKTITRQAAEEAFQRLKHNGLCVHSVTITAKDKACFKEKTLCQKDYCEFANGYYDRLNEAILDIFKNENSIDRVTIEKYARKHTLCPFELSLDLSYDADVVICDYNYIFDPKVSLKRLFEDQKKEAILLIDEAHNLVDRAREMYSADLQKSSFLTVKREYSGKNMALSHAAKEVNSIFLKLKKEEKSLYENIPEELLVAIENFRMVAEQELLLQSGKVTDEILLETYFLVRDFLRISKFYDERFVTYFELKKSEVRIKIFCLDPSSQITQMSKGYRSKIYFSATLNPIDYYQNLLGAGDEDYFLSIPSPFSSEQTDFHIKALSTRFKDRDRTKTKIVETLVSLLTNRKGNFLIFFPSYQYMMTVYEVFLKENLQVEILLQDKGMSEKEREGFLDAFQPRSSGTMIGFAVLGGIFSEGVDLKGDRLNGVVVVGVGLPQIGLERDLIKDYFQKTGKNGYDYAYVYPGINKVLQAGGRLIRSEKDTGTIILIDDRFLQPKYQNLLPNEWKQSRSHTL
ncbi:helicase C-terminal domain-containing protein [Bacillus sp. CGMCC 1.16607]|uniref:helicase C-terminal domain-containing protein n=1 Tax=Bacillus sp. CGMCC 1.16607 TaxID=3351842 RepID=UPI00362BD5CA